LLNREEGKVNRDEIYLMLIIDFYGRMEKLAFSLHFSVLSAKRFMQANRLP
jgi:hypothetical protein